MVYISGPCKGYPLCNYPAFDIAKKRLKALGFKVISPADIGRRIGDSLYEVYLREDLKGLLKCDTIYFLKGWEKSFGANIERLVAKALHFKEMYE